MTYKQNYYKHVMVVPNLGMIVDDIWEIRFGFVSHLLRLLIDFYHVFIKSFNLYHRNMRKARLEYNIS